MLCLRDAFRAILKDTDRMGGGLRIEPQQKRRCHSQPQLPFATYNVEWLVNAAIFYEELTRP